MTIKANASLLSRHSFAAHDTVAKALNACEKQFGESIQSVKEITSIPNPNRAVLLVKFAGGLKVKLLVSDYHFEPATPFMDLIESVRFPKVLFQYENWVAFEWIEGKPISELPVSSQIVEAAARVLRAIHETKINVEPDVRPAILKDVHLRLQKSTPLLVSEGIISEAQSQSILDSRTSPRPETLNVSLIHGDFSPANVIACGNELSVIDNEKMRVHVTDYDIGRASTLWEEWSHGSQSLFETYRRQSGLHFDPVSLRFWEMYDLVYRINYRLSAIRERHDFCIMKLRRILATGVSS